MKTAQTWADHNLAFPLSAARMNNIEERQTEAALVNLAGQGFINVAAPPYNAKGDGATDCTAAFQAALAAGKEGVVFVPPGFYRIKSSLTIPVSTTLIGLNPKTCALEAEGNIKLLVPEGANVISGLYLKAVTEQASGAAIDCSSGKPDNLWIENVQLGSNFFNGINLVANAGEFGGIHLRQIHFAEPGAGVKGYKGSGIVIGSSAVRTVGVWIDDVHMQVNSTADMVRGVRVNNTDSLHASRILVQNAAAGFTVGDTDASAKLTTNLELTRMQADGCTVGFELQKLSEESMFVGCSAEGGGTGAVIAEGASGMTWTGCKVFRNQGDGLRLEASVAPTYANSFVGCGFNYNGENAEATKAGVVIAAKAGGAVFSGCTFGNPGPSATGKQKFGMVLGNKSENVGVYGCRFHKNVTTLFKKEGEEVNINSKSAPTEAELEVGNLKS